MKPLLLAAIGFFSFYQLYTRSGIHLWNPRPTPTSFQSVPLDPTKDPIQTDLLADDPPSFQKTLEKGQFTITPLQRYRITGRVLSKKTYTLNWQFHLSPVDLAFGWGPLSTTQYDDHIEFWHGNRFYKYQSQRSLSISRQTVIQNSANEHLIPATPLIEAAIRSIEENEIIQLEGYLVQVSGQFEGRDYRWNTSLVRTDTGGGACELIYVERVVFEDGSVYGTTSRNLAGGLGGSSER